MFKGVEMSGKYPKKIKGFYEGVRKTLYSCRIVGYLPISGLLNRNSEFSRCSRAWSPYSFYYTTTLIFMIMTVVLHFYAVICRGNRYKAMGRLVKHCIAVTASIFLLKFSINWNFMLKKIEANEKLLPPFKKSERISKITNRITIFMLLVGFLEYVVNLFFTIQLFGCHSNHTSYIEAYYNTYYRWFMGKIPFNIVIIILIEIIKLKIAFVYYFVDVIVVAATLYLVYRFRDFNRLMRLRQRKCVHSNHTVWSDLQAHYTRLARLVKIIDDNINPFVFLSFLSSLLFICTTILDVIHKQKVKYINHHFHSCRTADSPDWVVVLDACTTIMSLSVKTTLVSALTAHLHTLSREPLNALHTIPASAYNLEMQRFMDQVYHSKVNLSGLQIFYVTRGTILSMLSTIITYELVILQLPHGQTLI